MWQLSLKKNYSSSPIICQIIALQRPKACNLPEVMNFPLYERKWFLLTTLRWDCYFAAHFCHIFHFGATATFFSVSQIREWFKKKKKLEFSNFVRDPPSPPLKLENIHFFYMTHRAIFLLLNFSHICVMKHTISKFSKKKFFIVSGLGTPRSLATQPTLGGLCCELEIGQNLISDHDVY